MDYGSAYRDGHHTVAPRRRTKAAARAVGRIRRLDAKDKGRRRGAKGQTATCPRPRPADAFLKATFVPRLSQVGEVVAIPDRAQMVGDFYKSLALLSRHYGIVPATVPDLAYPSNIAFSLADIRRKLEKNVRDFDGISIIREGCSTYLESRETFGTGSTLYYIPVVPLHAALHDADKRESAELLLSVCSYLYIHARVSYYREDDYLSYIYTMIRDWSEDSACEGEDETQTFEELDRADTVGNEMLKRIADSENLSLFEGRLKQYQGTGTVAGITKVAGDALALMRNYPERSIYANAEMPDEADWDWWEDTIDMNRYISFVAQNEGVVHDNLFEVVNAEFGEKARIQEPVIRKSFDGIQSTDADLAFEQAIFTLMDELIFEISKL